MKRINWIKVTELLKVTSPYLLISGLALLCSIFSVITGFFILDDYHQTVANPLIKSLAIENIFAIFSSFTLGMYQPLATLSFALDYQWLGLNPSIFHASNILIHIINSCLVFLLLRRLACQRYLALAVAIVFAIHPLQVESVAWISARSNLLFTLFYVAGLIYYLKYSSKPHWGKYLILSALFLLSLLSKASAVSFPIALLALDYYQGKLNLKKFIEKLPLLALSAIFIYIATLAKVNAYSFDPGQFNLWSKVSLIPYSLYLYFQNIIAPIDLQIFYPYPFASGGWLEPMKYLSWLIIPAIYLIFRFGNKKQILGILLLLISLAPHLPWTTANQTLIADRYLYPGILGAGLLIGETVKLAIDSNKLRPRLVWLLSVILGIALICLSISQHLKWFDNSTLLAESAIASPWSSLAQFHAANGYLADGLADEALASANQAVRLDNKNAYAHDLSASISMDYFQDYETAKSKYLRAITIFPSYAKLYYGLARSQMFLTDYQSAIANLNQAEKLNSNDTNLSNQINELRDQIMNKIK